MQKWVAFQKKNFENNFGEKFKKNKIHSFWSGVLLEHPLPPLTFRKIIVNTRKGLKNQLPPIKFSLPYQNTLATPLARVECPLWQSSLPPSTKFANELSERGILRINFLPFLVRNLPPLKFHLGYETVNKNPPINS